MKKLKKNKKMNKKTTQDNLQNPRLESWDHNNLINKINYGVLFLINLILNNEIEKKINLKK
jgi:hypothetical protein